MSENKKETVVEVAFEDWEGFDPASPEKGLLKAILLTAINDLKKTGSERKEAEEFLLSTDESYIFSFRTICDFLNVDPNKILMVSGLTPNSPETKPEKKTLEKAQQPENSQ